MLPRLRQRLGASRADPWDLAHAVGHVNLTKDHKPVHHASTGNPMHGPAQETAEVPARDKDQRARIRKSPLLR